MNSDVRARITTFKRIRQRRKRVALSGDRLMVVEQQKEECQDYLRELEEIMKEEELDEDIREMVKQLEKAKSIQILIYLLREGCTGPGNVRNNKEIVERVGGSPQTCLQRLKEHEKRGTVEIVLTDSFPWERQAYLSESGIVIAEAILEAIQTVTGER